MPTLPVEATPSAHVAQRTHNLSADEAAAARLHLTNASQQLESSASALIEAIETLKGARLDFLGAFNSVFSEDSELNSWLDVLESMDAPGATLAEASLLRMLSTAYLELPAISTAYQREEAAAALALAVARNFGRAIEGLQ